MNLSLVNASLSSILILEISLDGQKYFKNFVNKNQIQNDENQNDEAKLEPYKQE